MKKNIEIQYSKKGVFKILLLLLVLIVGGVVLILYPSELAGSFVFRTEGIVLFSGYFCLIVGVNGLVQHIYILTFVRVGLRITNEGIINNTEFLTSGIVKWSDIEEISKHKKSKNGIFVFIKNPKFYIKRTKNPLRLINIYAYYLIYKTPCFINQSILDIDTPVLMKLLQDKINENRY